MLKKTVLTFIVGVLLAGFLVAGLPRTSLAAEETTLLGKDVSLQVGYKIWYSKWQNSVTGFGVTQATSGWSPLMGPQATLTLYNRYFVSYQYLSTSYSFDESLLDTGANRRDTTLTGGARIWRGVGVFGGYYQSLQTFGSGLGFQDLGSNLIKGPIVGVFIAERLGESDFSLYGNIALGWFTYHNKVNGTILDEFSTDDVKAYSSEIGVNYTGPNIWKVGTALQIGFRAQLLQARFGANTAAVALAQITNPATTSVLAHDVTYGPTFMVSLRF